MKKPKPQIRKVFEKVIENGGKSVSGAMREVGYSPATATNPQKITESKSWEMLMDKYIPESLVVETHKEAFNANKIVTSPTEGDKILPDWQIRMKATELGYKLRGKLIDKADVTSNGKTLTGLLQINENHQPVGMANNSKKG